MGGRRARWRVEQQPDGSGRSAPWCALFVTGASDVGACTVHYALGSRSGQRVAPFARYMGTSVTFSHVTLVDSLTMTRGASLSPNQLVIR